MEATANWNTMLEVYATTSDNRCNISLELVVHGNICTCMHELEHNHHITICSVFVYELRATASSAL